MIGPDGIVRESNLPFEGIVDLSGRRISAIISILRQHSLTSACRTVGRVSRKWSVQVTRRLTRYNGSFDGVVVASIDPFSRP